MSAIACECGLLFASDEPSDVRLHRKHHDEWTNGAKSAGTSSGKILNLTAASS